MGMSFGGYLAPRAAAFEKRISALVANDGIYDFGVTQLASVPPDQREAFIAAVNQKASDKSPMHSATNEIVASRDRSAMRTNDPNRLESLPGQITNDKGRCHSLT
jgi:hypothetical protein